MNFYYIESSKLLPNVEPQNGLEKFIQFPLIRLIIVLLLVACVTILFGVINSSLKPILNLEAALFLEYLSILLLIASLLAVYGFYTKTVENRKAYEISLHKMMPELGAGWLLGLLLISFIVSILAIFGFYKIESFNSIGNVLHMFFDQMRTGFIEELLFRIIIFKLTEEIFGSWPAMAVQGVLFGYAHTGNPNASMLSTLALIFAFTLFFGAGYMITRRLWFIMGFHWSWNFFQAGIFGMHNSGHEMPSLINPNVSGPVWLTGGAWGLELSILSMFLLFSISIYFVKLVKERNQFIRPIWQRKT